MADETGEVVMVPRPTVAPLVLAMGMVLLAAGAAMSLAFVFIGALMLVYGLGLWIRQLAPDRGEIEEPRVEPALRPQPILGRAGGVGRMAAGMPGYRLRLPTEVHPISAGVKGGILGGLLMPIPALGWSLVSGHGLWYPINLLAGLVLPGVGSLSVTDLARFRLEFLVIGLIIHAVNSVTFGLIYGVLLPTLPALPKPVAWGGLALPMIWTTFSYFLMGLVNPLLNRQVDWPMFIVSQFVFGVAAATMIERNKKLSRLTAGVVAGAAGGLLMPIPALLWSLSSGHGIWYPINLLAGLVLPGMGKLQAAELTGFHPQWLAIAVTIHVAISLAIGAVFALILPRLRPIPTPLAWGALLMPLLWSAVSFGLMGVVNPLLQERVNWPWFIASQFVFGVATAVVVDRSERIFIPPAGEGKDSLGAFAAGTSGGGS